MPTPMRRVSSDAAVGEKDPLLGDFSKNRRSLSSPRPGTAPPRTPRPTGGADAQDGGTERTEPAAASPRAPQSRKRPGGGKDDNARYQKYEWIQRIMTCAVAWLTATALYWAFLTNQEYLGYGITLVVATVLNLVMWTYVYAWDESQGDIDVLRGLRGMCKDMCGKTEDRNVNIVYYLSLGAVVLVVLIDPYNHLLLMSVQFLSTCANTWYMYVLLPLNWRDGVASFLRRCMWSILPRKCTDCIWPISVNDKVDFRLAAVATAKAKHKDADGKVWWKLEFKQINRESIPAESSTRDELQKSTEEQQKPTWQLWLPPVTLWVREEDVRPTLHSADHGQHRADHGSPPPSPNPFRAQDPPFVSPMNSPTRQDLSAKPDAQQWPGRQQTEPLRRPGVTTEHRTDRAPVE